MRTATTTALSRKTGKWVLLMADDVPCHVQFDRIVKLRGLPNDAFSVVKFQESDGKAVYDEYLTTDQTNANKAAREKADLQMKEWDNKVAAEQEKMRKSNEDERSLRHKAEIEALNSKNTTHVNKIVTEDEVSVDKLYVDKDGLRTDGPTYEDWLVHGNKDKPYPPRGYAAKDTPAWKLKVEAEAAAAKSKQDAEAEAAAARAAANQNQKT